jgi:O-antigen ligase
MLRRLAVGAPPQPWIARSFAWLAAAACAVAGFSWLLLTPSPSPLPGAPTQNSAGPLASGSIAAMNHPAFAFSPGWRVDETGADPPEPVDPWLEPSGVLTFTYKGSELALLLAVGDYWGYLFVTVDGEPANLLPTMAGNHDSRGQPAGYKTLYAPEAQTAGGPAAQWFRVHRAPGAAVERLARVELWRSWGQIPVRAVAVDGLPPPAWPRWPGVLLLLVAFGLGVDQSAAALSPRRRMFAGTLHRWLRRIGAVLFWPVARRGDHFPFLLALIAGLLLAFSVWTRAWPLCILGLVLLAYAGSVRPIWWTAALLFGLPFYFSQTLPVLPQRAFSLIDVGVFGGMAVFSAHFLLFRPAQQPPAAHTSARATFTLPAPSRILFLIVAWALVCAFAAEHVAVALREWRTVFLAAGLFAVLLAASLYADPAPNFARWTLVGAWLAGGAAVALIGLWQFLTGASLITAEGVWRIRAVYGSPNNLALYLDRTLAVTLALALFLPHHAQTLTAPTLDRQDKVSFPFLLSLRALRGFLFLAAAVQLAALLLTFSKGALLLGLPTMLATLALGAPLVYGRGQEWRRLWWLAAVALVIGLALLPFLPSERFQRLLDLSQGTGFLRLQLWRSAWQMALDHPLLGVGPDNFLYAFRSGYLLPTAWQEPNLNHPHNWLLDWWTRLGLPGLLLAIAFFTAGLLRILRRLRSGEPRPETALDLGLLAAACAALAHGLIDASYALPDLMLVWVLLFGL